MRRGSVITLLATVGLLGAGVPARALELADVRGHMTIGFAHLFVSDTSSTPGGSLSFGARVDIPLTTSVRAGLGMGYHMLGSQTLVQGSLSSGIDYSMLEAVALLRWSPLKSGPDLILWGGPGLFRVKAELATTSTGLVFTPYAVDDTRVGAAFNITLAPRKATPVRAGLDLGLRVVPLDDVTWTVATVGVALLY